MFERNEQCSCDVNLRGEEMEVVRESGYFRLILSKNGSGKVEVESRAADRRRVEGALTALRNQKMLLVEGGRNQRNRVLVIRRKSSYFITKKQGKDVRGRGAKPG